MVLGLNKIEGSYSDPKACIIARIIGQKNLLKNRQKFVKKFFKKKKLVKTNRQKCFQKIRKKDSAKKFVKKKTCQTIRQKNCQKFVKKNRNLSKNSS